MNNLALEAERKKYSAIVNEIQRVQKIIQNTERTITILKELKENPKELFINLGNGVILKTNIDKIQLNYAISKTSFKEKNIDEILEILETKVNNLKNTLKKLNEMAEKSEKNIEKLTSLFSKIK